jgi:hypothetical protein
LTEREKERNRHAQDDFREPAGEGYRGFHGLGNAVKADQAAKVEGE